MGARSSRAWTALGSKDFICGQWRDIKGFKQGDNVQYATKKDSRTFRGELTEENSEENIEEMGAET